MTPLLSALATSLVIAGGAFAIVFGLRFFPIARPKSDQMELDLEIVPDYIKRTRAMAHDLHRTADKISEDVARLKSKPRRRG